VGRRETRRKGREKKGAGSQEGRAGGRKGEQGERKGVWGGRKGEQGRRKGEQGEGEGAGERFLGIEAVFLLERPKGKLLPLPVPDGNPQDFQVEGHDSGPCLLFFLREHVLTETFQWQEGRPTGTPASARREPPGLPGRDIPTDPATLAPARVFPSSSPVLCTFVVSL